jgi:arylformamidase
MKMIDITLTISPSLPVWPGNAQVRLERVRKIEEGSNSNNSVLEMGVHTGTHVDAPVHFLNDSKMGVDSLPLDVLVGFCCVVEIPADAAVINREVLQSVYIPQSSQRILFKTRNSTFWEKNLPDFQEDFVGVSEDGAQFLVDRGVKLVGLDYLSISPYKKSRPTHEVFLKNGVILLEGINLSKVSEGFYSLFCLPIKLAGSDGAPARVMLIEEE